MVDMAMMSSLFSSLKVAGDLAKSLINIRDSALISEKICDLTSQIMTAQQCALEAQGKQEELLRENASLKETILSMKGWVGEEKKYFLESLGGVFVYSLQDDLINANEEFHQICKNCYGKQKKTILQQEARGTNDKITSAYYFLVCDNCKTRTPVSVPRKKRVFKYLKPMSYGG